MARVTTQLYKNCQMLGHINGQSDRTTIKTLSNCLAKSMARVTALLYNLVKCLAIAMARVTAQLYKNCQMLSHINGQSDRTTIPKNLD